MPVSTLICTFRVPPHCTAWVDAETLLPRYAEFSSDGAVVVSVKLLAFSCTLNEPEN